jgi:hypothetical protein
MSETKSPGAVAALGAVEIDGPRRCVGSENSLHESFSQAPIFAEIVGSDRGAKGHTVSTAAPVLAICRSAPPSAVDLIARAIERVRPDLVRVKPIKERVRAFWAGVKAARDLGASDVVYEKFRQLAADTGLLADLGQHADETVAHLIRWGLLGRDPFGRT